MNWKSLMKNQNKTINLKDKLNFGKHEGRFIEEILEEEPTYIRWCIENIYWFKLSETDEQKVYELAEQADKYDDNDIGCFECLSDYC